MLKSFLIALLVVALAFGASKSAIKSAHKTAHTILIGVDGKCSATAIGPHAVLTASHCEQKVSTFSFEDGVTHQILGVLRDGADHTIILTDGFFPSYAHVETGLLSQGDDVFIFGNPAIYKDLYRQGQFAGIYKKDEYTFHLYNLSIFSGDSGAAVFDENGTVRDVISSVRVFENEGVLWSVAESLPIQFTPEQIQQAQDFNGQPNNSIAP